MVSTDELLSEFGMADGVKVCIERETYEMTRSCNTFTPQIKGAARATFRM